MGSSPPRRFRLSLSLLRAAMVAVLCLVAPTSAVAAADAPMAKAKGDNGDVKIHAVGTSFIDERNQPHVCRFYLDAFDFDAHQHVMWTISQQPPTGHTQVLSGTLDLDAHGDGTSAVFGLPAGHYKLVWTFTGEKGSAKHKVFWSDCAAIASPPPGSTVVSGGGAVIGTVGSNGKIITPVGPTAPAAMLAQTGDHSGVWAAIAAALLAGGGFLRYRTRRVARRH